MTSRLLMGIFTLLLLSGCYSSYVPDTEQGVLDLRKWDHKALPVVVIRGEYEFYPHTILDAGMSEETPSYLAWPLIWKDGQGFASYRLRILVPKELQGTRLAIDFPFQSTAIKYFIQGKTVFESGHFSADSSQSKPSRQRRIVEFDVEGEQIELVAHLSNFHHARGGTWYPLKLGLLSDLHEDRQRKIVMDAIVIFMAMGIGLFYLSRSLIGFDLVSFSLGLSGCFLALRYSTLNERILEIFFPMSFSLGLRLEYLSLYILYEIYVIFSVIYFAKLVSRRTKYVYGILCVLLNASLLLPSLIFSKLLVFAQLFALLGNIHMVYVTFIGHRRHVPGAKYILGGFAALFLATLVDTILINLLRQYETFFAPIGNLAFLLAQSLAAGSRETVYLRRLKEERSGRTHSYEQLRKVIYPHQLNQIQKGGELEATMPTNLGEACVISFDIIGSSRINHIKARQFFRNVFRRCYHLMNEGYDGENPRAAAYRIKEMGDGFLCSVGYPFESLTDNPANEAVLLSMRFIHALQDESKLLEPEKPICCAIGIALDAIIGFFPETGTKEYDLFGRAAILATRYESMRHHFRRSEDSHSILIIHERVYISLSQNLRKGFVNVDLKQAGITVRDDPMARSIYYRIVEPFGSQSPPQAEAS